MKKMNRLYTAAFVLALACVPFGLAAMAAVYLFQKTELAVLFVLGLPFFYALEKRLSKRSAGR